MDETYLSSKKDEEREDENNTDEVTLRLYDLSDLEDFMAWANDENVIKFSGWYPNTYATKEASMNHLLYSVIPHPWYRAVCLQNRAIGEIVLTLDSRSGSCRAEVGYSLGSEYWGKGIMTKAMKMAVSSIFIDYPELQRLEAMVDVENPASQRVCEKVGFQREGIMRNYYLNKGKLMNMVMLSLLPTDPSLKSLLFG